uniref:Uncharacterized protein n=1 Tax=Arundo donax TaxID=35708 RepID=A0A0A9GNV6_ARUDO
MHNYLGYHLPLYVQLLLLEHQVSMRKIKHAADKTELLLTTIPGCPEH